jgi:hypothetical protein
MIVTAFSRRLSQPLAAGPAQDGRNLPWRRRGAALVAAGPSDYPVSVNVEVTGKNQ